jgi:hypothetical protein
MRCKMQASVQDDSSRKALVKLPLLAAVFGEYSFTPVESDVYT